VLAALVPDTLPAAAAEVAPDPEAALAGVALAGVVLPPADVGLGTAAAVVPAATPETHAVQPSTQEATELPVSDDTHLLKHAAINTTHHERQN
jgi:hypothetical protein